MFLEIAHNATCRIKPKGATTSEYSGVNLIDHVHRVQQVSFASGWRTSSDIDTPYSGSVAENDGAACSGLKIGIVAHTDVGDISDVIMHG
jgi:hypothetical protein